MSVGIYRLIFASALVALAAFGAGQDLASVSADPGSTIGSGTINVTVYLDSYGSSPIIVNLFSSSPELSVPSTVTVPAGATSASVPATVSPTPGSGLTQVQVRATLGIKAVAGSLAIAENTGNLSLSAPLVSPSTVANVVRWTDYPVDFAGSAYAFKIQRLTVSSGAVTTLSPGPMPVDVYVDTTAAVGAAYQYELQLVRASDGFLIASSSYSASVSRLSTGTTISWVSPPPPTVAQSGEITLHLHPSSATVDGGSLLIDGQMYTSADADPVNNPSTPTDLYLLVDTTTLGNGLHRIQFVSDPVTTNSVVSAATLIKVGNDVATLKVRDMADASDAQWATMTAQLPSDATSYQIDISNSDTGTIVRSYSGLVPSSLLIGSLPLIDIAWDFRDNSGSPVAADDYDFNVTAQTPSGPKQHKHHLTYVTSPPQILYLYLRSVPATNSTFIATSQSIKHNLTFMANNNSLTAQMLVTAKADKATNLKIRNWLKNTVTILGLYGHGSAGSTHGGSYPEFHWGGYSIYPADVTTPDGRYLDDVMPSRFMCLPHTLAGRSYHFAFIDCCYSGGYDGAGDEGYEAPPGNGGIWYSALNMGSGDCCLAWSGACAMNEHANGTESLWARWRRQLWYRLCNADTITGAITYAGFHCAPPEYFSPWNPEDRLFYWGDLYSTLP